MSRVTDEVARVVKECQEYARQHGWNDYVYVPFYPLTVTRLYEHPEETTGN